MVLKGSIKFLILIQVLILSFCSFSMEKDDFIEKDSAIVAQLPKDFIKNDFYFTIDEDFRKVIIEFIQILTTKLTIEEIQYSLENTLSHNLKKIVPLIDEASYSYHRWAIPFLNDLKTFHYQRAAHKLPILLTKIENNPSTTSGLITQSLMYKMLSLNIEAYDDDKLRYIFNNDIYKNIFQSFIRLFFIAFFTGICNRGIISYEQICTLAFFLPIYGIIVYGLNAQNERRAFERIKIVLTQRLKMIEHQLALLKD